jgi:hypothetical protein
MICGAVSGVNRIVANVDSHGHALEFQTQDSKELHSPRKTSFCTGRRSHREELRLT